jgi:ribosome-binding protein aMBF1 (putative translation factor)
MKPSKRKRLESTGWKVGTVEEFLDLADDEASMIDIRLRLGRALRVERERRSLTQTQLGRKLGSSQSRIAKMESGDPSVSLDLLVRSLLKLGARSDDVARHIGGKTASRAA